MSNFIASKPTFDATSTGVQNTLIDSFFKTLLVAYSSTGSISVPGPNGSATLTLGSALGFVPFVIFFTDINGSGAYQLQAPTPPGGVAQGLLPADPWTYKYTTDSVTNTYTAHYMYLVTYLPSQGAGSSASNIGSGNQFINVSQNGIDATTASLENLTYSSKVQGVQVIATQKFTLAFTGTGVSLTVSFSHGLGAANPFVGAITNYDSNDGFSTNDGLGARVRNFIDLSNILGIIVSVDSTNFNATFNNNVNGRAYSYNFTVFYIPQP